MGDAKIANLGGDQFLIAFGNLENAWPAIKSSMVEFSGLFLSLNLWKPGPNYVPRIMCVRCFGVPLHSWDEKVFTTGRSWVYPKKLQIGPIWNMVGCAGELITTI